ncbi:MAG: transcriptional regulator [Subtercola sp.]|nr:transcriptional regulator [Subtercola sp.]
MCSQPRVSGSDPSKTLFVAGDTMGVLPNDERSDVPDDLDLRKLRYFVVLAEELHYGRASERLHLAQPVLTRQIRRLEDELGVQLFDRDSRGTALTASGVALLEHARPLLASAAALRNELAPVHSLRVGVMPGLLVTLTVTAFERAVPDTRVELHRVGWDDQISVLHEQRVDLVYAREPFDTTGLSTRFLCEEPRFAVLPIDHPLAGGEPIDIAELRSSVLLQHPSAVPEWAQVATPKSLSSARSVTPPATVEEKLERVASGRGFVILPESTTIFYRRPDVAVVAIRDLDPNRVTLAWSAISKHPGRDAFIDAAVRNPPAPR